LGIGCLTLLFIPFRKPSLEGLSWTFDRLFCLKEQFSTGYQIARLDSKDPIHLALLSDVDKLSFSCTRRVAKRGWWMFPDLLSLLVVLCLFIYVFHVEFNQPKIAQFHASPDRFGITALGRDPKMLDLFQIQLKAVENLEEDTPMGMPNTEDGKTGSAPGMQGFNNPNNPLRSDMLNALSNSMKEMGSQFKEDASTYEISQGLMSGDLKSTAAAIEKLADQLEQMTPESLQQISEMMRKEAEILNDEGLPQASEALNQAADGMEKASNEAGKEESQDLITAKESLDQIAASLRELDYQLDDQLAIDNPNAGGGEATPYDSGTVVNNQNQSEPQEFSRLFGDGELLKFEPGDQSGAPLPGLPDKDSPLDQQFNIDQSAFTLSDNFYINYIVPYYYPWKWHYVVSKYFQRD
jgi:hypothetical protein